MATNKNTFSWEDPFQLSAQLTEDERQVQEAARAYCQEKLLPRVKDAFLNETTDVAIFREMGELGLLGPTIPEQYGGAGLNYVCYGLVAREVERVDSGYRSMMSVQSSLVMVPINEFGTEAQKQKNLPKLVAAANAAARERARAGLAAGDERYLPARDKGPQKKFARDWVDARFSIGELLVPIMLVIILISFIQVPGSDPYIVANIANGIMWLFVAVLLIDVMIMTARMKSRMVKKFGSVDRGVRWYAMMRTLQMRFMRMPKPQVARKQFPS